MDSTEPVTKRYVIKVYDDRVRPRRLWSVYTDDYVQPASVARAVMGIRHEWTYGDCLDRGWVKDEGSDYHFKAEWGFCDVGDYLFHAGEYVDLIHALYNLIPDWIDVISIRLLVTDRVAAANNPTTTVSSAKPPTIDSDTEETTIQQNGGTSQTPKAKNDVSVVEEAQSKELVSSGSSGEKKPQQADDNEHSSEKGTSKASGTATAPPSMGSKPTLETSGTMSEGYLKTPPAIASSQIEAIAPIDYLQHLFNKSTYPPAKELYQIMKDEKVDMGTSLGLKLFNFAAKLAPPAIDVPINRGEGEETAVTDKAGESTNETAGIALEQGSLPDKRVDTIAGDNIAQDKLDIITEMLSQMSAKLNTTSAKVDILASTEKSALNKAATASTDDTTNPPEDPLTAMANKRDTLLDIIKDLPTSPTAKEVSLSLDGTTNLARILEAAHQLQISDDVEENGSNSGESTEAHLGGAGMPNGSWVDIESDRDADGDEGYWGSGSKLDPSTTERLTPPARVLPKESNPDTSSRIQAARKGPQCGLGDCRGLDLAPLRRDEAMHFAQHRRREPTAKQAIKDQLALERDVDPCKSYSDKIAARKERSTRYTSPLGEVDGLDNAYALRLHRRISELNERPLEQLPYSRPGGRHGRYTGYEAPYHRRGPIIPRSPSPDNRPSPPSTSAGMPATTGPFMPAYPAYPTYPYQQEVFQYAPTYPWSRHAPQSFGPGSHRAGPSPQWY